MTGDVRETPGSGMMRLKEVRLHLTLRNLVMLQREKLVSGQSLQAIVCRALDAYFGQVCSGPSEMDAGLSDGPQPT